MITLSLQELNALIELLQRTPMSVAEGLYVSGLLKRLTEEAQKTEPDQNQKTKKGETT